jgi:hypothetical protein
LKWWRDRLYRKWEIQPGDEVVITCEKFWRNPFLRQFVANPHNLAWLDWRAVNRYCKAQIIDSSLKTEAMINGINQFLRYAIEHGDLKNPPMILIRGYAQ